MSCATLGEAFDRTLAYRRIYTVGARYEMQLDPDATRIIWYPWPGDLANPGYRAAMDYHVADMENAIRRLGRGAPRPTAIRLVHATPGSSCSPGGSTTSERTWHVDGPVDRVTIQMNLRPIQFELADVGFFDPAAIKARIPTGSQSRPRDDGGRTFA